MNKHFFSLLKNKKYRFIFAAFLLVIAAGLIVYFINDYTFFVSVYGDYQKLNAGLENWVTSVENKPLAFLLILILFALKTFIMILPYNAIYLLSGVMFSLPVAFLVNVAGTVVQLTLSYYKGKHFQSMLPMFLRKFRRLNRVLERDGGNLMLLFGLRIVPFFPLNIVSELYGNGNCGFLQFIIVSIVGLIPKLVGYTLIGKSVFNPSSPLFWIPFAMLIAISGIAVYFFDRFIQRRNALETAGKMAVKKEK